MIKPKWGECIECADGRHVPLIAKRCQRHYREHRRKASGASARDAQFAKLSARIRADRPDCEARLACCTGRATEVHHKAGRTGALLLREDLLLPVCGACHSMIHTMSLEDAIAKGLRVRRSRSDI